MKARQAGVLASVAGLLLLAACASDDAPRVDAARTPSDAPQPSRLPAPASAEPSCGARAEVWLAASRRARDVQGFESFLERAEALAAGCPDAPGPAWARGLALRRLGRLSEADDLLDRAGAGRSRDDDWSVRIAVERGIVLAALDRPDAAETLFTQAMGGAREQGNASLEAIAASNLAGLFLRRGEWARAESAIDRACTLLESLGNPRGVEARYNQAVLRMELGDLARSRETLETVWSRSRSAATRGKAAGRLGLVAALAGDDATARAWFERATNAFASDPDLAAEAARVDLHRGELAIERARPAEALPYLDRAIDAAAPTDRLLARIARVVARLDLARAESRYDAPIEAEVSAPLHAELDAVLDTARARGRVEPEWMARAARGKLSLAEGRPADAVPQLRAAIAEIEAQRLSLSPDGAGLRFLRRKWEPFADLAAALALVGGATAPDAVLDVAARSRALALRAAFPELDRRVVSAEHDLRTVAPAPLLVDVFLGRDRGVVTTVSGGRARTTVVPGLRELRPHLRAWRRALERPLHSAVARLDPAADLARDLAHGEALYDSLLAPIARSLETAPRAYFVLDGELALIPADAIPWPGEDRFLADVVPTGVLPVAAPPRAWTRPPTPLLLAGAPDLPEGGRHPALPRAARELEAVRRLWPEGETVDLTGRALALDRLLAVDASRFGTLHFATHALASSFDPRRSAVVLSNGDALGLDRVRELRLDDPLVVLSACRTGDGEIVPGEGIVGLSSAFLLAGAKGLVASLWSVEDASAEALMTRFHHALAEGAEPVDALATARRAVRAERPHPAHWAPFVLVERP